MTGLTGLITAALLNSIWQDALLALALAAVLYLLRRAVPQARYAAACAALALMTVIPVTTAAIVNAGGAGVPVRVTTAAAASVLPASTVAEPSRVHRAPTLMASLRAWALPIWCLGVLVFSVRLAGSGMHAAALRRRGHAADAWLVDIVSRVATGLGVHHRIDVLVPSGYPGVATIGWVRPVILMPAALTIGLPLSQVEALIAHEVAHIRRHDYLVNLAQLVVETVYFYHPAIWWVSRRIRTERELCCDDAAVAWSGDAHVYARALRTVAAGLPQPALAASGGSLVRRVERLLGVPASEPRVSPRTGLAALVLAVLLVGGGSAWVTAQQTPPASGGATLSGTVYDPSGVPAENTPLTLASHSRGINVLEASTTDAAGRFRFEHLPRGTYSIVTPVSDAVQPPLFDIGPQDVTMTVRLGIDPVAVDIRVCADCRPSAPQVPDSTTQPGIPENPVIVSAMPVGGWEAFNASPREYPADLKAARVEGAATIEARIAADGTTTSARTVAASNDRVAASASALVEQLRWRPTLVHGAPVEAPLQVTVEYVLKGE